MIVPGFISEGRRHRFILHSSFASYLLEIISQSSSDFRHGAFVIINGSKSFLIGSILSDTRGGYSWIADHRYLKVWIRLSSLDSRVIR
jgi:hypothetical protein